MMIAHQRLLELLSYDPETGEFTWLVSTSNRVKVGAIAGNVKSNCYVEIGVDGGRYFAHRLAWFYMLGRWPVSGIDHKDTNPSNNRWNNLREASQAENMQNERRARSSNLCGLQGVSWNSSSRKWFSRITIVGQQKNLGSFGTAAEAHAAYIKAKASLHPFSTIN